MKQKLYGIVVIIAIITVGFAIVSCDNDSNDKNDDTPQPHESTITAFGKTATVIGDAAISTADFNTAVGRLQEALVWMDGLGDEITTKERTGFTAMMGRTITIVISNAAPASVNGALTVGVDWLKLNTKQQIGNAIASLAENDAFAG